MTQTYKTVTVDELYSHNAKVSFEISNFQVEFQGHNCNLKGNVEPSVEHLAPQI